MFFFVYVNFGVLGLFMIVFVDVELWIGGMLVRSEFVDVIGLVEFLLGEV